MNKVVLLVLTGAIALLTEGCSFFSDFADSRKKLDQEAAKPNPVKVNPSANQAKEGNVDGEEFADLEENSFSVQPIAGLIPATNPDSRVRSSVRGRQDPFSTVTLTPRIEIEAQEELEKTSGENNRNFNRFNNNDNKNKSKASNNNLNTQTKAQTQAQASKGINKSATAAVAAATGFVPTLAQQVVISGLYEAGERTRLILKSPEESTSRYVEVGQYLSNGRVLVKSINHKNRANPIVILEEGGVEVSKTIGEITEDTDDKVSTLPATQSASKTVFNVSLGN